MKSSRMLITLLAHITPALNDVIFSDMALKVPALNVCPWECDFEHMKSNANKGQCNKG